jgi:long-chain acyl-CoA synthetase
LPHRNTDHTTALEAHYRKSAFVKEVCVIDGLYAVVVPDMDRMRARKIVNVGDLLRFELEGLSHALPVEQRLAGYEIWFDALPRATTQDIDRREVERRVRERQRLSDVTDAPLPDADRSWLDESHAAAAVGLISDRARGRRLWPDANLELDLGLDSIERVELLTELEQRFGVTLPSPTEILTVRQLVDGLRGGQAGTQAVGETWAALLRERPRFDWLLRKRTLAAPALWCLLRLVRPLFVRVRVSGLHNLPPAGPFIITPNHQSYVDPFILCSVLPYRVFKDLFLVGAPEYFETPFTRWVARTANLVPVDPDSHLIPAMRAGAFGLAHKKILLVFPEGERSIDGTVKKFKKGAPILAQHLGVPIVPVALKGIHELWPRNGRINWSLVAPWSGHRVRIEIGQPITFAAAANYSDRATTLRDRVNAMWRALSS